MRSRRGVVRVKPGKSQGSLRGSQDKCTGFEYPKIRPACPPATPDNNYENFYGIPFYPVRHVPTGRYLDGKRNFCVS